MEIEEDIYGDSSIKFLQINMHKRKECNIEISHLIDDNTIALCQEPNVYKGKITHINSRLEVVKTDGQNPRACIILDPKIEYIQLHQFCDKDQVTIMVECKTNNHKIVIASVYMPYDAVDPPPPEKMQQLVQFCADNNKKLIIGCDANSHNTAWGSSDNNIRGENLLEYILATNLQISNLGNMPTFRNAIREEVIDITLTSMDIADRIIEWQVRDWEVFSDHQLIQFRLEATNEKRSTSFRNVRTTRWTGYQASLREKIETRRTLELENEDLETMVDHLNQSMMKAYHDNNQIKNKNTEFKLPWWSHELQRAKLRASTARRKYKRDPTEEKKTIKTRTEKDYRRLMRQTKDSHWMNFCTGMENTSALSRVHKLMKNGKHAQIGTLIKDDNTYTTNAEETLDELMTKLFPGCTPDHHYNVEDRTPIYRINGALTEEEIDQITDEKQIGEAIRAFDPYKTPGHDGIYPVLMQKGLLFITPYLRQIYKKSLIESRPANQWLATKVVFIPKPGKKDYVHAKSYRPISLNSFVMKGLERLILWHIERKHLIMNPLNGRSFHIGQVCLWTPQLIRSQLKLKMH